MGMHTKKIILGLFIFCLMSHNILANLDSNRIFFLLHRGELVDAINLYQESIESGKHEHEILEQISQIILEQGARDSNPEIQLMALFGAGISANEKALYVIEECIRSPNPQLQLAALGLIARSQSENVDEVLRIALKSPFLIIRLEALYHLAENKNPRVATYTESLMAIVNDELLPIFPEIFVVAGDGPSTRMLKRLITHPEENVRLATVLALTKQKRDDFLPKIRTLATHHSPRQLEVCANAFGTLKDGASIPRLRWLSTSHHEHVKLSSLLALYRLGCKDVKNDIENMAIQEDLYAIAALQEISGTEETLSNLINSSNPHVRINATLGLLEKKDKRSLKILPEILLTDSRDYAFTKIFSKGRSLSAWKVIPSATQNFEETPQLHEISLKLKEEALIKTLELDEKSFLKIADTILDSKQNELVPMLVSLLENKRSADTINLLKKHQQKVGSPLIRQYCNLALYRLREIGPYNDLIKNWIVTHMHETLFRFTPPSKDEDKIGGTFALTPDETSKLLIDSIESLAKAQNTLSVDILLEIIKNGNPNNRYALAGLLMRIAQ